MTSISSLIERLRSHKDCTCVDFRGEDPDCIYCSAASEIERLQQELEILATRQWKPIETAPTDGSMFQKAADSYLVRYWRG
jgi:hypothetical protein